MTNLGSMIRRAPEQLMMDMLGGVWLVSLVLGALHLPSFL